MFPGVAESTRYVIRAHSTGKLTPPISPGTPQEFVSCSLEVRGYEIFSAFPVAEIQDSRDESIFIANLGLLGKMTGCAAVVSNRLETRSNGRVLLDTNLKALGTLGKLSSSLVPIVPSNLF